MSVETYLRNLLQFAEAGWAKSDRQRFDLIDTLAESERKNKALSLELTNRTAELNSYKAHVEQLQKTVIARSDNTPKPDPHDWIVGYVTTSGTKWYLYEKGTRLVTIDREKAVRMTNAEAYPQYIALSWTDLRFMETASAVDSTPKPAPREWIVGYETADGRTLYVHWPATDALPYTKVRDEAFRMGKTEAEAVFGRIAARPRFMVRV